MTIDRMVVGFAGFVVLASVGLGLWLSLWWFALTVFVGANLLQSAFTGFCPLALVLKRLGVKEGPAFG
jgi:hypothetical protein